MSWSLPGRERELPGVRWCRRREWWEAPVVFGKELRALLLLWIGVCGRSTAKQGRADNASAQLVRSDEDSVAKLLPVYQGRDTRSIGWLEK
jgi:hypothetical protein